MVDVLSLMHTGTLLQNTHPAAYFPRLAVPIAWKAWVTAFKREPWLHLQAQCVATVECQRCLQAMHWPLQTETLYRFAQDEAQAAKLDSEVEEDVLVMTPSLNLLELMEDDLLMAMPYAPMHEHCEMAGLKPSSIGNPVELDATRLYTHPLKNLRQMMEQKKKSDT